MAAAALALAFGAFAPAALAAACDDEIKMTEAALGEASGYLTGARKKVNNIFNKAKARRDAGKKKGCVKLAKKARKVIAKASACNREIKTAETEMNNATGISPQRMLPVEKAMAKAKDLRDNGKYGSCVKRAKRVVELIEGSA